VWSQAVAFEVYGLHLVLVLLTILLFLRGLQEQKEEPNTVSRLLIASAFTMGLSFANHMMTVLLIPAFLFLYFSVLGWTPVCRRRLLLLVPWSLLALSIYLYLPIRSSAEPLLDWGQTSTFDRLVRHVSGGQYRVWMFSGSGVIRKQLEYFIRHLPDEIHFSMIPILIGGMVLTIKKSLRLFFFTSILAATTIAYAVNYDIFDINSYFLLAFVVFAWWISVALDWVAGEIPSNHVMRAIFAILLFALPGIQIAAHWGDADQRRNTLVHDFARNVLETIEPNGMLVTSQWDYTVAPLWYFQLIEGRRRDLVVVDKNLLMNRPWYFAQMERIWPGIFDEVRTERDLFLEQLVLFESDQLFNPATIQSSWNMFWEKFLFTSAAKRSVYADWRIVNELPRFQMMQPAGIFVRLSNSFLSPSAKRIPVFRPWPKEDILTRDLKTMYVGGAVQYGLFLKSRGDERSAKEWFDFGASVDPASPYLRMIEIPPKP
jgi:hypothetical protein